MGVKKIITFKFIFHNIARYDVFTNSKNNIVLLFTIIIKKNHIETSPSHTCYSSVYLFNFYGNYKIGIGIAFSVPQVTGQFPGHIAVTSNNNSTSYLHVILIMYNIKLVRSAYHSR